MEGCDRLTLLADHHWLLKYTPDDGNLVRLFYVPALEDAVRYDRLTGYFTADALALAARGIEGLVRNEGHMRLVVGCTLNSPEVEAIERGEKLRDLIERRLTTIPLTPPDVDATGALELLAWLIARGILDIKVAVPCDHHGRPTAESAIFHEKSGIIEDRTGDRIAWTGSLNETRAGWSANWETINVYQSWGADAQRVDMEEDNFARIWAGKSPHVITLDLPSALRDDLLRFMPDGDIPRRLKHSGAAAVDITHPDSPPVEPKHPPLVDTRRMVWGFIRHAAELPHGGDRVGETTCAVTPWPHQVRAFERLYEHWPPKLLIADEVGLGKTIQAGLLLRQAWLAGRAKRILILAPKAVLPQWQLELREKFNLNWPIYDGQKLTWSSCPGMRGQEVRLVSRQTWHQEPVVIASSQLMRRQDRATELLEQAEPWDLIILDEAHHARRKGAGGVTEGGPNALLGLMQDLTEQTSGLILLTATPMQVHPIEVWDLLNLLGLPEEWTGVSFLQFFADLEVPNPSAEVMDRLASLFQAVERRYGPALTDEAARLCGGSRLKANKILRALRDHSGIPRRSLETSERRIALQLLRRNTPIGRLVSRHTRELLRRYFKAGMLSTPIADRHVEDRFITMTDDEWRLYEAVEHYIASTYNQASDKERSAIGFVMTIYRRRLASSFHALAETLQGHLDAIVSGNQAALLTRADEDTPDDETSDEALDAEEVAALQREALALEERSDIELLLSDIRRLPPDSKRTRLLETIGELRADGYAQAMVFTQYTDTMDFLRDELIATGNMRVMCFSGRGGEVPAADGSWRVISRDDAKRRFREGEADVLLCTDAAAEGLNFQFCGALVNYDMPWNPMRVEQRIGRIDRLGQQHAIIRIINLHYEGTVEADIYRALRDRIGLFESVVGRLQPILAQLPRAIAGAVLSGADLDPHRRASLISDITASVDRSSSGFDLDAVTDTELTIPPRSDSTLTMDDLHRVLMTPEAMPAGVIVEPLPPREYAYLAPGMAERVRVTTDPGFFEQHSESVELWSPGSPVFPQPEAVATLAELPPESTMGTILLS